MVKLTMKEKFAFKFILGEKIYQRWYGRFLSFGVDYWRIKRVVKRISNWLEWCDIWSSEGEMLNRKAKEAYKNKDYFKARNLYHEAVGCYHIGQHIFFIDEEKKEFAQKMARENYVKAINLYSESERPIRVDIPYRDTFIPGYLRLSNTKTSPLVIFVNGMDNIKEAEGHAQGAFYQQAGFNFLTFDGLGQGEMWKNRKFDSKEYPELISTIIDWFESSDYDIDLNKIALIGYSLGGYLAPMCSSYDNRIKCVIGNSGLVYIGGVTGLKKLNPIWQRGVTYMTGTKTLEEASNMFDWDIEDAKSLKIPLLFYHAGKDEVMPSPQLHAKKMMQWAKGPKELKYYKDGEHCTQNYLDEVFPETIDWLNKQFEIVR